MAKRPTNYCSVKAGRRWSRTGWKPDKYEEYQKDKKNRGKDLEKESDRE